MDTEKPIASPSSPVLALPKELRELMGVMALVLVMIAFIAAIFGISLFGAHLSSGIIGHCWQLQDIDGKTYKIDTCTGKTILLKHATGEKN